MNTYIYYTPNNMLFALLEAQALTVATNYF